MIKEKITKRKNELTLWSQTKIKKKEDYCLEMEEVLPTLRQFS